MCSQLINNVNISFEICANVSGGLWRSRGGAAGTEREHSGPGAGQVRGRFGGGSWKPRGSQRQTPLWTFLWDSYLPLLEPFSELAIKEKTNTPAKHPNSICTGAAGAQLWKASWPACGAHLFPRIS